MQEDGWDDLRPRLPTNIEAPPCVPNMYIGIRACQHTQKEGM